MQSLDYTQFSDNAHSEEHFDPRERSTKAQRQRGCIKNTMWGLQWSVYWRDRETIEDKDNRTLTSSGSEWHEECQCSTLRSDETRDQLGGLHSSRQRDESDGEEDQREHSNQEDQELQPVFRIPPEPSMGLHYQGHIYNSLSICYSIGQFLWPIYL